MIDIVRSVKSIFGFSNYTGSSKNGLALQGSWLPSITTSGQAVTASNLMTQSTVYQAIYVLISGVGSVDWRVVERLPGGGKRVVCDHPYNDLLRLDPNDDISFKSIVETIMMHICTRGNAYLQIDRNGYLQPSDLYVLDPTIIQPWRDVDQGGKLYYLLNGKTIPSAEIIHIAAPGLDGLIGLSPVNHLRNLVGVAMALDDFSGSFFASGCNVRGILEVAEELSDEAQANLRKSMEAVHAGPGNGNKLLVLEGGAKFQATTTTPNEAQFNETQKLIMLKIAQAFNLPPTKLAIYDNTALNTLEESNLDFFTTSLLPWVERITNALNRKLFTKEERKRYAIEHDDSSALKGRMADRVAVWKTLKDMGVINTNEVREELGLPPIEGGDTFMYASNNFSPLSGATSNPKIEDSGNLDESDSGE